MLIRPHDRSDDEPRWRRFVQDQGFGHFIVADPAGGVPVAVPTQFLLENHRVIFHLAANNPVFEALAAPVDALLSVAGDWAYIPGAWKAIGDEDPRWGIPTTYYGAVQLTGRVTVVDDEREIAEILRRQLGALEPEGDYVDPIEHSAGLMAIRGLSLSIDAVRAKFKYGGNVDRPHRDHVAANLEERGGPGDLGARSHLA